MAGKTSSKKRQGSKAKSIKKKSRIGAKSTEVVYHSTKEIKVERALIENFIGLQKVMVNLSGKFDNLSSKISKLLELFEVSAKSLVRKEIAPLDESEAKKIIEKLDTLSKQAGLIGKGLALIHEVGTENQSPMIPLTTQKNKTILPASSIALKKTIDSEPSEKMAKEGGFEKSIATNDEETT